MNPIAISFCSVFPKKLVRPLFDHDVRVLPGFVLEFVRPHFAVHLEREKVRARELRIVGIAFGPREQRVVGEV